MRRRDVLQHLAEEWIKLVGTLHESRTSLMAICKHGNIIVEHGRLRLVDHDGMFVPEMAGCPPASWAITLSIHAEVRILDSALDIFRRWLSISHLSLWLSNRVCALSFRMKI